ncbi:MAG TPA: protein phosphatase 2C domain-containing protein, partial [Gemmataceae bacterium]|nr:protein phosphatase 2C domain-containing protein [Gemmataceae bacterium]
FRLAAAEADRPADPDLARLKAFLEEAARKAQVALLREAQARKCDLKDLHTTFLLLIHAPFRDRDLVAALQVGDGAIGLYTDDDRHTLLGVADHGQYSSETCFLTTPHVEHSFGSRVVFAIKKGVRAIAVLCDGVSDDFFPEDKRLIDLFVGGAIPDLKTRTGDKVWGLLHKENGVVRDPQGGKALLDWLRYEKRGSSDDRTLVLLYRSPEP